MKAVPGGGRKTVVVQISAGRLLDVLKTSSVGSSLVEVSLFPIANPLPGMDKTAQKVTLKLRRRPALYNDDENNAYDDLKRKVGRYLASTIGERFRRKTRLNKLARTCRHEYPFRVQLNILHATSSLQSIVDRLKIKMNDFQPPSATIALEEWTDFEATCYFLIKPPSNQGSAESGSLRVGEENMGMRLAAELLTNQSVPGKEVVKKAGLQIGSIIGANTVAGAAGSQIDSRELMQVTHKIMDSYRRAAVLARRGSHWTLLNNVAQSFYESVHLMGSLGKRFPSIQEALNQGLPFSAYMVADSLLDMMKQFQNSPLSFPSSITGGLALTFTPAMDDVAAINRTFIIKLTMFAVYILYKSEKWEKSCDLMLRLLVLTNYQMVDVIGPLLISAQKKLTHRIESSGGPIPQPHFIETGPVTPDKYLTLQLRLVVSFSRIFLFNKMLHFYGKLLQIHSGSRKYSQIGPCQPTRSSSCSANVERWSVVANNSRAS